MSHLRNTTSNQPGQDENGDYPEYSPTMCSTPADYGIESKSSKPFAFTSDSKQNQVFFPADFNTAAVSRSHSSPFPDEKAAVKCVPVGWKGQSHVWKLFLFLWIGIILVFILVSYFAEKINQWMCYTMECVREYVGDNRTLTLLFSGFVLSFLSVLLYSVMWCPSKHADYARDDNLVSQIPQHSNQIVHNSDDGKHAKSSSYNFPCRRTFSGTGSDVWHDFRRYFENLAILNNWSKEQSRRTLLCCLRGQAETYAYGLPPYIQSDCDALFMQMEQRFGLINMKDSYVADAKLRRKWKNESYREFGQAIEDLYRKAYPESAEIVREQSVSTFLDNCHDSSDFRLAVKRTRPRTLQDAITAAIQEESLRLTEREKVKDKRVFKIQNKPNYRRGSPIQTNSRNNWGNGSRGRSGFSDALEQGNRVGNSGN